MGGPIARRCKVDGRAAKRMAGAEVDHLEFRIFLKINFNYFN
jgi:hypothetical protein